MLASKDLDPAYLVRLAKAAPPGVDRLALEAVRALDATAAHDDPRVAKVADVIRGILTETIEQGGHNLA